METFCPKSEKLEGVSVALALASAAEDRIDTKRSCRRSSSVSVEPGGPSTRADTQTRPMPAIAPPSAIGE